MASLKTKGDNCPNEKEKTIRDKVDAKYNLRSINEDFFDTNIVITDVTQKNFKRQIQFLKLKIFSKNYENWQQLMAILLHFSMKN